MRVNSFLSSLILVAVLFTGCQSDSADYKIALKDGREFLCDSKPELQRKTGYYRFKNLQDRDALLRADEVLLIEEQDD